MPWASSLLRWDAGEFDGGFGAKIDHRADTTLPLVPLPHAATDLQVHAELLAIHGAGH